MSQEITFKIGEHVYEGVLLPVDDGEEIFWLLFSEILEPLGEMLGGAGSLAGIMEGEIPEGMDMSGVLSALGRALRRNDMRALTTRLITASNLRRDGVQLDKIGMSKAYRANYFEKGRAALEIIKANGFFPQLG